jgi:hypothetical protein
MPRDQGVLIYIYCVIYYSVCHYILIIDNAQLLRNPIVICVVTISIHAYETSSLLRSASTLRILCFHRILKYNIISYMDS